MTRKKRKAQPFKKGLRENLDGTFTIQFMKWTWENGRWVKRPVRERLKGKTKKQAQKIRADRVAENEHEPLTAAPSVVATYAVGRQLLLDDYQLQRRKTLPNLNHLDAYFNEDTPLEDITAAEVQAFVLARDRQGAAVASVNNDLAHLHRILALAHERGLIASVPRIRKRNARNARTGFYDDADVAAILTHVEDPTRRAIVTFASVTGWRLQEVLGLRWRNVDLDQGVVRLEPNTTKNDEGRAFPFGAHKQLARTLSDQRTRVAAACPWVFPQANGERYREIRPWFPAAVAAAAETRPHLSGRVFHDFRRSAVRNLVERAGVSEKVAMSLTGHKTRTVFERYHIVHASDQWAAVAKLATEHDATVLDITDRLRQAVSA
jgi:integrase